MGLSLRLSHLDNVIERLLIAVQKLAQGIRRALMWENENAKQGNQQLSVGIGRVACVGGIAPLRTGRRGPWPASVGCPALRRFGRCSRTPPTSPRRCTPRKYGRGYAKK